MTRIASGALQFLHDVRHAWKHGDAMIATLGQLAAEIPGKLGKKSIDVKLDEVPRVAGRSMASIAWTARHGHGIKPDLSVAPGRSVAGFLARRFDAPLILDTAAASTCVQHEGVDLSGGKVLVTNACRVRDGIVSAWMKDKDGASKDHLSMETNEFDRNHLIVYRQDRSTAFVPIDVDHHDEWSRDDDLEKTWQRFVAAYPRDMAHHYYAPHNKFFDFRIPFVVGLVERIARDERLSGKKKGRAAAVAKDVMRDPHIPDVMRDFKDTREPAVAAEVARKMLLARFGKNFSVAEAKKNLESIKNPVVGDAVVDINVSGKLPSRFDPCDIIRNVIIGGYMTDDGRERAGAYLDEKCGGELFT
jgi:hypothetical protein